MKLNGRYKILSPTGFVDFDGIQKVDKKDRINIILKNKNLLCSPNHMIFMKSGWAKAKDIKKNDYVKTKERFECVVDVKYEPGKFEYYDLINVDGGNSYFTNDILSHNCQFLGSSGTLISTQRLSSMTYMQPILEDGEGFKMYYPPKKDHNYIMTVDTAEGLGLDSHAISIFDVTEKPYQQVAVYRNAYLEPLLLPELCISLGEKYNQAFILIELNSLGPEVANTLHIDLEYENMMFTTMSGRKGQVLGGGFGGQVQLGLKSTTQSKRVSCSLTKTLIENDQLIINDYDTYSEFTTFARSKNSFNAEEGCNDDMVTTVRLFAWITGQKYFKEDMEQDLRDNLNRQSIDRMEEMLVPFGVIDNGCSDENIHTRIEHHQNGGEFGAEAFGDASFFGD